VSELDAGDRDRSIRKRLEPCHRCAPPLDRAVVLLDEIIEILVRADLDVAPARVLSPQQPQGATTRHMAVERHLSSDARKRRRERLSKERLCSRRLATTGNGSTTGRRQRGPKAGDARSYRGAPGFREHVAVEIVEFGVVDSTIRVTMRATSSVKRFVSNRQLCEMMGLETGRLKFHG
jgi:hypothetical protein